MIFVSAFVPVENNSGCLISKLTPLDRKVSVKLNKSAGRESFNILFGSPEVSEVPKLWKLVPLFDEFLLQALKINRI